MILEITQNIPIQTFNSHCYALKTGPLELLEINPFTPFLYSFIYLMKHAIYRSSIVLYAKR